MRFLTRLTLLTVSVILLLSFNVSSPARAQENISELLSLNVDPAFDGRFRANQWMPLRISIQNQGDAINGRVVVRPETSGGGLPNTYSTPVEIPSNSSQALFLYITARSNANVLRVELLTDDNTVITSQDVIVRDIFPRDRMYAVVTQATTGIVDLTSLAVGGYEAFQANWTTDNIPNRAAAMDALDILMFTDVDTGTLTVPQQEAIRSWVINGGHLIVTGGASWQSTAAGLEELLPLVPDNSVTSTDLGTIATFAGVDANALNGEVIVARGELIDEAQVLVADEAGQPLIARRSLGNGMVDYAVFDPGSQPFRDWEALPEVWFSLVASINSRPSWAYGLANYERATTSVEILPGLNLLPAALGLIAFLSVYVLLIGPVNYLLLSRLNRRELAWVTIPVFILIFSALAWTFGFELRGNQATLSRITVVQSWADSDEARMDQLIGLLAPRRDNYTLSMTDDRLLRPISASLSGGGVLSANQQLQTDIRQTNQFEAVEFPVDASFIAAFNATGNIPAPEIGGLLTLAYSEYDATNPEANNTQTLQGAIRNDSEITLNDPVLLARGEIIRFDTPFTPGEVLTINASDLVVGDGEGDSLQPASPSPLEYAGGEANPFFTSTVTGFRGNLSAYQSAASSTAMDILGEENYERFNFSVSFDDDAETQEMRRRQAFLDAFIIDQYASTARGNRVFLAGWADAAPTTEAVDGAGYDVVDTTLYIIEIEVRREEVPPNDVLITRDQFTWISRERLGLNDVGPNDLMLFNNTEAVFRFTPLPDAVLSEVDELTLIVERTRSTWSDGAVQLWNWRERDWEQVELDTNQRIVIEDGTRIHPDARDTDLARFLGPQNAVQVRLIRDQVGASIFVELLAVEQRGAF